MFIYYFIFVSVMTFGTVEILRFLTLSVIYCRKCDLVDAIQLLKLFKKKGKQTKIKEKRETRKFQLIISYSHTDIFKCNIID